VAARKELALVLPAGAVVGTGPFHFGGFPGQWYPGEPIAVSALGFETPDEAIEAAKGLPLVVCKLEIEATKEATD
jgi:hypothetical protein